MMELLLGLGIILFYFKVFVAIIRLQNGIGIGNVLLIS